MFNLQSSAAVNFLRVDDVEEKALAEGQETWILQWAGTGLAGSGFTKQVLWASHDLP